MGSNHSSRFRIGRDGGTAYPGGIWEESDSRNVSPWINTYDIAKSVSKLLKISLNGNFTAPVHLENGGRVLDVGSEFGVWAAEVALDHPRAEVIGIEQNEAMISEAERRKQPPNVRFVHTPSMDNLPYTDKCFDYVHYKPSMTDIIAGFWVGYVNEMVRVTKPGGYIELTICDANICNSGPLTNNLLRELRKLATGQGVELFPAYKMSSVFREHQNLVFIQETRHPQSLGKGDPGAKEGMIVFKQFFLPFAYMAAEPLGLAPEDVEKYVEQCVEECSEHRAYTMSYNTFAMRSLFS